jgi:hypothetical protein
LQQPSTTQTHREKPVMEYRGLITVDTLRARIRSQEFDMRENV